MEREAQLNAKERDLVAREQTLVATLHSNDEEIEALIWQRTKELEDEQKKTLEA